LHVEGHMWDFGEKFNKRHDCRHLAQAVWHAENANFLEVGDIYD
jgi:hypothetical protein